MDTVGSLKVSSQYISQMHNNFEFGIKFVYDCKDCNRDIHDDSVMKTSWQRYERFL